MKRKLFRQLFLLSLAALLISSGFMFVLMHKERMDELQQQVRMEAEFLKTALEMNPKPYLKTLEASTKIQSLSRITLIGPDGTVQFDNAAQPDELENHLGRPEVQAALKNGSGEITRQSSTLGEQTYYYALALDDGSVIRVANTTDSAWSSLTEHIPLIILIILGVCILAMVLARQQAKRLVRPINRLDLEHPLLNDTYEELAPLLSRIEKQHREIESQMQSIRRAKEELNAITEKMNEGLVVLSSKGTVLSMNHSAQRVLGLGEGDQTGKHIWQLNRSPQMLHIVEQAEAGRSADAMWEQDGRFYHLMISPVNGEGVNGSVLFALDETEKYQAEQLRREFSANVSHELKTPLQSISGYAELIANNMAKEEDIPLFGRRIYVEAQWMIALVGDIIKLSRLDEAQTDVHMQPVELLSLCRGIAERLSERAQKAEVSLTVTGQPVTIQGTEQILEEMVYNLCDNGIRYNRPGGTVTVTVAPHEKGAEIIVSDTGIGILKEHQARVFERFYRVDKSHSKETGGTGLGLSIVKHAAMYHGATVELKSKPGKGTTVTIRF